MSKNETNLQITGKFLRCLYSFKSVFYEQVFSFIPCDIDFKNYNENILNNKIMLNRSNGTS